MTETPVPVAGSLTDFSAYWAHFLRTLFVSTAYGEDGPSEDEINAIVSARMASPEVQAQIGALTDGKMASADTQALIDGQTAQQMESETIQALIDSRTQEKISDPSLRAQAEEAAKAQIRPQVEAATRKKIRYAVTHLSEDDVQALVAQQMQSAAVQQQIETAVAEQMASAQVRGLIAGNIETQMAPAGVRSRIAQETETQRQSQTYLNGVAEALEKNWENSEAYRALSDLRVRLDDLQAFYDGLSDYTGGVNGLMRGAQEMKDGTDTFRRETENIGDTVSEKISDIIADKTGAGVPLASFVDPRNTDVESVQFVITTPAIRVKTVQTEAASAPENSGILQKIRGLFR